MKILAQYKGQLLITLFLFLAILAMPFQDYMERTFTTNDMNYPEEAIGIVSVSEGLMSVPDNAGSILLNTNHIYLKKGTYEVTFDVRSQTEGNTIDVCDSLSVNPDNTPGQVLASSPIPVNGELVRMTFTVDDYVKGIQFRVHAKSATQFASIYLLSQYGLYRDPWIYAGLVLLASALLLFFRTRRNIRPEVLTLLGLAALWSSLPLCFPWLFQGHDMYFHYGRLFNLGSDILQGSLPVRIHPLMFQGFGYMPSVFYSEFFFYPFALLGILGMSPIGCYKVLMICVNFATAGVSYYAFSRLCRSARVGLITSLLYTLSAYRVVNLYTRSALGELLAAIFLPLLLLGMYHLFLGDSRKWLLSVLAFTALFQSHIITTEIAIGFSLLFGIWNIRKLRDRPRLIRLLTAAVTTVLLNLWFILPMLDHMRYPLLVFDEVRNLANSSLYAAQIFDVGLNNPTGEALGALSVAGEMPYSIGIVLMLGSVLFLLSCFRDKKKDFLTKLGGYSLLLGLLCLYASSVYFPWAAVQRIQLLNRLAGNMQFAFRFLPFATLFLCLTSAIGIYSFFKPGESRQLLYVLCGVLCIYNSGTYFSDFINESETFVTWENQLDHVMDTDCLYLVCDPDPDSYLSIRRMVRQEITFTPSGQTVLTDCFRKGTKAGFTYDKGESSNDSYVDVPFNYYPYFHAYDSAGNPLDTSHGELNRLRVTLPEASRDTVAVRLELPGYYRAGDVISLVTLLLILLSVYLRRKQGKAKQEYKGGSYERSSSI